MNAGDRYRGRKIYHLASAIREDGGVKALCFKGDRPINLGIALWTITPKFVTCAKCRKLMAEKKRMTAQGGGT